MNLLSCENQKMTYLWQEDLVRMGLQWKAVYNEYIRMQPIQEYYDFLQSKLYFFSKEDTAKERILQRHLYESLISCICIEKYREMNDQNNVSRETRLLDAGSGPGLPGYLFACFQKEKNVFLLDSSRRKLSTLEKWYREQSQPPPKLQFIYKRLEEHREQYDLITTRAVIPFPVIVELCAHLQSKGGILALLGTEFHISRTVKHYLDQYNYVSREIISPSELQFLGHREILILEKLKTKPQIPSTWKTIQRSIKHWKK